MKDRIENVIRKHASRCDYLEVHIEETEESRVTFSGPRIEDIGRKLDFGGNVRALVKGGWGFASFNSIERLSEFAEHAIDQARLVGSEKSQLAPVEPVRADVPLDLKDDPRAVPLKRKVEILRAYNDRALEAHASIVSTSTRYYDRDRRFWFANSEGSLIHQERIDIGGAVTPIASKGGDTQMYSVPFGSSDDFGVVLGKESAVDAACEIAVAKLDAPKVRGGEYTVILDPRLGGTFIHEAFGHLSEGDNVYEDTSLQEVMQLGRVFGKPILNVYDTGLDKGHRGYLVYDDEGVPTEKTYLLKEGALVGARPLGRWASGRPGTRDRSTTGSSPYAGCGTRSSMEAARASRTCSQTLVSGSTASPRREARPTARCSRSPRRTRT